MRSHRPMLSTVSIMPGIDTGAPERTDTRRGFLSPPKASPQACSRRRVHSPSAACRIGRAASPSRWCSRHQSGAEHEGLRHGHPGRRHALQVEGLEPHAVHVARHGPRVGKADAEDRAGAVVRVHLDHQLAEHRVAQLERRVHEGVRRGLEVARALDEPEEAAEVAGLRGDEALRAAVDLVAAPLQGHDAVDGLEEVLRVLARAAAMQRARGLHGLQVFLHALHGQRGQRAQRRVQGLRARRRAA